MTRVARLVAFAAVVTGLSACSSPVEPGNVKCDPRRQDCTNVNYVNPNVNYVNPNVNYVNPNV